MTRKQAGRRLSFACRVRACVWACVVRLRSTRVCVGMAHGVVVHLLVTTGRTNEQGAEIDLRGDPEGNTSLS